MKKIYLFLFPLFLLLFSFNVSADSFNKIEVAYGYDRGSSTGIWSGYSTTLSHNFGTTDATIGYINTLNNILTLNNHFQNGNFYSVNFTLQNDYSAYTSSFTLYDALQEMGHFKLKCSTSSSGSFLEPEQCFTNYNVRFQKTAYDEVKAIITFTPLTNFTRLLVNTTREGSPTGSQLISEYFAFSNFSYTMSTGGTGEIIDNQNQNTQDIIDNQNENTQELINNINENFNGCFNYDNIYSRTRNPYYNNIGYLNSDGSITSSNLFRYTYYLIVSSDKTYFIHRNNNDILNQYYCLYDTNKTLISCTSMGSSTTTNFAPTQDGFVRISYSIDGNNSLQFTGQYCTSKFNELNEDVLSSAGTISDSIQQQIDSQKVCNTIDKSAIEENGSYLSFNGTVEVDNSYGITKYIKINNYTKIKMITTTASFGNSSLCFYNTNKSIISCIRNRNLVQNENINIPTAAEYIRFSINNTLNKPQFEICNNGNQSIGDAITDSNIDHGTGSDFFDGFTSQDFGLSQIITIPLTTIQSLTSQSCVPLEIPIPFTNGNIPLPCMTQVYEQNVPIIYNLWKIVSFGIVAYLIAVDIFHIVKGFKDPESDKVEVLDL